MNMNMNKNERVEREMNNMSSKQTLLLSYDKEKHNEQTRFILLYIVYSSCAVYKDQIC